MTDPILELEDVVVEFPQRGRDSAGRRRTLTAVNEVNLILNEGETLGLVGESGSGKSTLLRGILGLQPLTRGTIRFRGTPLSGMLRAERKRVRQSMQVVFQDPFTSLDARMTVHEVVAEPLRIVRRYDRARVEHLMEQVGLSPDLGARRPAEFSGGQRQRIAIARALALDPALLILDEPVSALDVSIQAQVINLLKDLQRDLGLTYLFVGHDLSVIRTMSHRVATMYLGRIVEEGPQRSVFSHPAHPYTEALISAMPAMEQTVPRERITLVGEPPDPASPPSGCSFRTRCHRAFADCSESVPALEPVAHEESERFPRLHLAACFAAPRTDPTTTPSRPLEPLTSEAT